MDLTLLQQVQAYVDSEAASKAGAAILRLVMLVVVVGVIRSGSSSLRATFCGILSDDRPRSD
jgi:hypothetical protein